MHFNNSRSTRKSTGNESERTLNHRLFYDRVKQVRASLATCRARRNVGLFQFNSVVDISQRYVLLKIEIRFCEPGMLQETHMPASLCYKVVHGFIIIYSP